MPEKPAYEELESRVKELENRIKELEQAGSREKGLEKAFYKCSESFYKAVRELPQAAAYTDKNLRYGFVNKAYLRKFSSASEDIAGKTLPEVIGKEAFEKLSPHVEKALGGEPVRYQERFEPPFDAPLDIDGVLIPDFAEDGSVQGFYDILTEITPYMKMQEKLGSSEAILNEAQEIAQMGSFVWNLRTDTLFWSRNMFTIAGLDPDASYGSLSEAIINMIHPDDRESVEQQIADMLQKRRTWQMEFRLVRPDGQVIWLRSSSKFTFGEDGEPASCIGVHYDITEKKQSEDVIRLYEVIVSAASQPMAVIDLNYRYLMVNRSYEEFCGMKKNEIIGKSAPELFGREFFSNTAKAEIDKCLSGEEVSYGSWFSSPGLGRRYMHVSYYPYKDKSGGIIGLISISYDLTEQKNTEEKLRTAVEQQEAVFDCSMVGIMLLHNRIITKVNRRMAEMLGYAQEEIEGFSPEQLHLTHEHFVDFGEKFYWRLAQQDIVQAEYPLRHKNGSTVWCLFSGRAIAPPDLGRGAVWVIDDITERKRVEEALRESEEKLSNIIEFFPDAILAIDMEKRVTIWNKAIEEMTGIPAAEMIGRGGHAYTVPFYGEVRPQLMDLVLEDSKEISDYYPSIIRQGNTLLAEVYCNALYNSKGAWIFAKVSPLHDASGKLIGAIESIRDISSQKEAEDALRKSEMKYRGLFESIADGVAECDLDGKIISCNRAYLEMTGHTEEEITALTYEDLTPEKWREADEAAIKKALENGYSDQYEKERLCKDGRTIPVSIRIWLKRDDEGRPSGFWGIIRDISDRVNAQAEREKLLSQLHQSQKMESIGRLAGGVAHDLNNLLSPILGYGEMLIEDSSPDDPRKKPTEEIVSAGRRAQALVRQLLAFSRKQPLQFRSIDINDLLKNFKSLLLRTLREDIRIEMHLADRIPRVKGDLGQIEQVIMNLAVNSQDAMPQGGRLIIETAQAELDENYAETEEPAAPGGYVKLAISDTGSGMDEHTLEQIFEPFFTTKERGKGTGLGMSTVYGIVKQHGGHIKAYSEPGTGTTIKLYFPASAEPFRQSASSPQKYQNTRGTETILLAEDDQQVRNLASTVLSRHGYNVLAAANGREALLQLGSHEGRINMLLTDVIMPDINGKELYDQALSLHPEIKVLYMSGYTDDLIAHHGVIDEGVNFIEKPFNIKALAAKVREILDQ